MNYIKTINNIFQKRDKLLKGKEYLSIIIYFLVLFSIDFSGALDYYGQSLIRRAINMIKRLDPLNYEKKLKPFCIKYKKALDSNDIQQLQSIKIPDNNDFGVLTRVGTTTHQCCEKYSDEETDIIKNISEKIRVTYENKLGKPLYYLKSNKATIYRYHGNKSQHLWHVDPQNLEEIYNVIVCIKKKGNISPLQCKKKDGSEHSIHFEEGDAAFFNGGTTVHQVPPNEDPDSQRTVLAIAFTSDKKLSKNKDNSNNLCTYLEGGNNYLHVFTLAFSVFLLNLIASTISGINVLSYKFLVLYIFAVMIVQKYLPEYVYDFGLGTGRPSSISYNLLLLFSAICCTLSPKGGIVFYSYFLLGDVFFTSNWVEYD